MFSLAFPGSFLSSSLSSPLVQKSPVRSYPPVDHGDGHQNRGYMRTKRDPGAVQRIPVVADWPELANLLAAINTPDSPIESVG
jgi:hypothetical protein